MKKPKQLEFGFMKEAIYDTSLEAIVGLSVGFGFGTWNSIHVYNTMDKLGLLEPSKLYGQGSETQILGIITTSALVFTGLYIGAKAVQLIKNAYKQK